jgi:hypothetical protein
MEFIINSGNWEFFKEMMGDLDLYNNQGVLAIVRTMSYAGQEPQTEILNLVRREYDSAVERDGAAAARTEFERSFESGRLIACGLLVKYVKDNERFLQSVLYGALNHTSDVGPLKFLLRHFSKHVKYEWVESLALGGHYDALRLLFESDAPLADPVDPSRNLISSAAMGGQIKPLGYLIDDLRDAYARRGMSVKDQIETAIEHLEAATKNSPVDSSGQTPWRQKFLRDEILPYLKSKIRENQNEIR